MKKKQMATEVANAILNTKVDSSKDFSKMLEYFRYKTATTLDAMLDTGILRNSITWYVRAAERLGLLQAVFKAPDSHTGRMAKHYSSDPEQWVKPSDNQLRLWED